MTKRCLSLCWEIDEVENAVHAARMLCDGIWQSQHATETDMRLAPRAASAVLALVGERLRLVRRVVRKTAPVDLLAAPHNTFDEDGEGGDESDVLLAAGEGHKR